MHGAELTPEQILASVPLPHAEAGAQLPSGNEDPHRRVRPLACGALTLSVIMLHHGPITRISRC